MSLGAGTIDTTYIVLKSGWPVAQRQMQGVPPDGFLGAQHHNVASEGGSRNLYRVGDQVTVYDSTNKGWATLTYLQFGASPGVSCDAAAVCSIQGSTGNTSKVWYMVTNDPDDLLVDAGQGPMCIALSAMTDSYYGWFWTDGVAPEVLVPGLATTVKTYFDAATEGNVSITYGDATGTDELGLLEVTAAAMATNGYILTTATGS